MDYVQFSIMIISFIGLFVWNRTESRTDMRHMDLKLESNRNITLEVQKEIKEQINVIQKENQSLIRAIQEEIKDFHGRLCAIEERKK